MGLESKDKCPSCSKEIVLKKNNKGFFECPLCEVNFSHNKKKFIIGIPLGLVIAVILYVTTNIAPMAIAFVAAGIMVVCLKGMPSYNIE